MRMLYLFQIVIDFEFLLATTSPAFEDLSLNDCPRSDHECSFPAKRTFHPVVHAVIYDLSQILVSHWGI